MANRQRTVAAATLGCKVNLYDTEAMLEEFAQRGFNIVEFEDAADIYIINTCTVTNLGDKKSRQLIRRARKQNPKSLIVAAGCYAQVAPEELAAIEGVNLVLGTKERKNIAEFIEQYAEQDAEQDAVSCRVSDIMEERIYEELKVNKLKGRTRAYLKIQEGCDNFCTYCIIPYARGPVRSRKEEDILREAEQFAKNDFKEIVLTGIHVASYGKDLKSTNLLRLVRLVHEIDGIERIRFSSIDPRIVTEDFLVLLKEKEKICDHLHLSLQCGCDSTLKRMGRKYSAESYAAAVSALRKVRPDIAITTDIIVGFPGETEEDFQSSYGFCKQIAFAKIHVFPYSAKKGTKAAEFKDQIPKNKKEERAKQMIVLSEGMEKDFMNNFIGRTMTVLFESGSEGHTSNYIKVRVNSEEELKNQLRSVIITGHNEAFLEAYAKPFPIA